jgi:hypothetical protein
MEAIRSSETSVYVPSTQRHIPEDDIIHIIDQCAPMNPHVIKNQGSHSSNECNSALILTVKTGSTFVGSK